jgi:oligopeptidase B
MQAPIPKLVDHVVRYGKVGNEDRGSDPMDPPRERNDPLFWLRDDSRANPEVIQHLRQEEEYFKTKTTDLSDLTDTIYKEHISHIQETDMTAPYRNGAFLYYTRTVAGLSYKIHCRVPAGRTPGDVSAEQVILDENVLAEGKSHCEVRQVHFSESHDRCAYSVDFTGDELFSIYFMDAVPHGNTANGGVALVLREETIVGTNGDIIWGLDNNTLFYTTKDAAKRDDKIWRRVLSDSVNADVLLHSEADTVFYAIAGKSLDGKTLVVGSGSSETTELYLIDVASVQQATNADAVLKTLIRKREKGVRYSVEPHGASDLVILTNEGDCPNNKIVLTTRDDAGNWSNVLVAHDDAVFYQGVAVFEKFLVVDGRCNGLTRVWTMPVAGGESFRGQELREYVQKEPVFTVEPVHGHNQEYSADSFRVIYSSMTTPSTWYDVCPISHNATAVKVRLVGGGFHAEDYVCERRFAKAPDGTMIPMSVVFRKDLDVSKPQPCMLYGYGSYGICLDPEFSISYLPYLDRGMVYAVAHVRGGGEMGRRWYEVGAKYLTKRNTFQDFVSCAEALIEAKVTTPQQLACEGRSAGGLLIGAVLNMRPDLFSCAIAGVPFVDVMTTMCDPSIPLTTGEWEEWGNPNEYKYFEYMKSYSPIDNVARQAYPHIFIHAGLHDPRVAFWEPAKWAAKLRMEKTDTNDVLLKMEMDSGHFSASDRYKYWKEMALQQAFVVKHVVKRLL